MKWQVDGDKLAAERRAKRWSVADFAGRSKISQRTIRRAELHNARLGHDTVIALARTLNVSPDTFATPCALDAVRAAKKDLRKPTELETYVDLAAGKPAAPPVEHEGEIYESLGPHAFQNIMTAHVPYDGRRYALRGRVKTQWAATDGEASSLGGKAGVAARFYLLCPVTRAKQLRVTAYTTRAEHTLAMQGALGEAIVVLARVVLAREGETGFSFFERGAPRPWTFVVEAVRRS